MSKLFKSPNSTVERFRNSRGQDVPIDTFLYACLEAEQTKKALSSNQKQSIQWPTLTDLSPEDLDSEIAAQNLQDIFEDLMSWYSANYPDLSTNLAWDYGVVSVVVLPLVSLASDLNTVYTKKSGESLPDYEPGAEETNQVWSMIRSLIERLFSSKSSYIMRYLEWSFGKEKIIQPEPGSRPPVGRFGPGFQNRSSSGGRSGPPPRDGGGNRDRRPQKPRRDDRGGGDRDAGRSKDGRNHRAEQARGNRKDFDRPNHHRKPQEANAEMEAAAIQACKEAFTHLESNPGEEKIILQPQNSFYRRIQHQVIVSNGYHSESTGDGQDRAVVIFRKP